MFSKAREAPSVVSTRVLRTHRLNEVENFRLHGKIRTIDNEIQSNYSQISDEIDGVRKNLMRIKKLKNNLSVSVERRKLLREKGVFVIPSPGLDDDEGVTLRRTDGKKVVIRGKECYDGEVIRRYIDINFDFSKQSISESNAENDHEEDNDHTSCDDTLKDRGKVLHYRIIVPPLHPGSRRNFKDYEEEEKEEILDLNLPPSEEYLSSLRSSPFRFKSQNLNARRDSRQCRRRSKSQLKLSGENKTVSNLDTLTQEDKTKAEVKNVQNEEKSLATLSANTLSLKEIHSTASKCLRPKTAEESTANRLKSRPLSSDSIKLPNFSNEKTKEHCNETKSRKYQIVLEQNPSRKSDIAIPGAGQKLLDRRPSIEDIVKIHITKPIPETIEDWTTSEQQESFSEQNEESKDNDSAEEYGLGDDVSWTEQIIRTTLTPLVDASSSKQTTKKHHRKRSQARPRTVPINSKLIEDNQSMMSYSSKFSRCRTESFNSNANNTISTTTKGRRKSNVTFAESERKLQLSNDEIIYDARPEKALSKGYTTMQMTIRGKQVRICIPKFSKDEVIDRARAQTAAQMADERTRGNTSSPAKQQKQHKQLIMS